jgi:hypothetical protein
VIAHCLLRVAAGLALHRQAQGALTTPAQAERYRGSREGTFHRILRS